MTERAEGFWWVRVGVDWSQSWLTKGRLHVFCILNGEVSVSVWNPASDAVEWGPYLGKEPGKGDLRVVEALGHGYRAQGPLRGTREEAERDAGLRSARERTEVAIAAGHTCGTCLHSVPCPEVLGSTGAPSLRCAHPGGQAGDGYTDHCLAPSWCPGWASGGPACPLCKQRVVVNNAGVIRKHPDPLTKGRDCIESGETMGAAEERLAQRLRGEGEAAKCGAEHHGLRCIKPAVHADGHEAWAVGGPVFWPAEPSTDPL